MNFLRPFATEQFSPSYYLTTAAKGSGFMLIKFLHNYNEVCVCELQILKENEK